MKKIKDERLVLKNLKNIRTAYVIQTLGIIGILGYDVIQGGLDQMRSNPLWSVFMITTVISAYLSMSISVDEYPSKKSPRKGFLISLIVVTLISVAVGIAISLSTGIGTGILIGGVIFLCSVLPCAYFFYLRKQRQDEELDG
ncbi:hypothetical protein IMZ31_05750 [Pontibacillus sp. ALD_SL1]|uniref:hypothetical protein n=1 Tax=Pontibacillus sp. ALD_SL1 TaxID=2777185 RepID=UPI001A9667AA|nr:hypothetical protein [Pontibacillus sp. ALD_SL1]QST01069.1 hypothetical protein IMZ31_05750 [Pontibacillus sp. ALD_SL1]